MRSNRLRTIAFFGFLIIAISGCAGCSKSGENRLKRTDRPGTETRIQPKETTDDATNNGPSSTIDPDEIAEASRPEPAPGGKTEIDMVEEGGIYKVPVYVNNIPMTFIFDTGASNISLSATEAAFLYKQGTLTQEDVLGEGRFSDANGDISTGTIIQLRTVRIGDRSLQNVKASIVHNDRAPLLLGQSALAQFGKISIDYQRKKIIFE